MGRDGVVTSVCPQEPDGGVDSADEGPPPLSSSQGGDTPEEARRPTAYGGLRAAYL